MEDYMIKNDKEGKLKRKVKNLFPSRCKPELDVMNKLNKHTFSSALTLDLRHLSCPNTKLIPVLVISSFYGNVVEEMPPNVPTQQGQKNVPIQWFSKCQIMVESATFGSKFAALHICKEMVVALCYKLQMFGDPLEVPVNVFCDNQGFVKNASLPKTTLTKKHNGINFHLACETAEAGILHVGKEDGTTNLADLLTK
eukprot:8117541-Ditylum_brightwellii.AAC.2